MVARCPDAKSFQSLALLKAVFRAHTPFLVCIEISPKIKDITRLLSLLLLCFCASNHAVLDIMVVYSYLAMMLVLRDMQLGCGIHILVLDAPLALVVDEATTAASAPLAAKV